MAESNSEPLICPCGFFGTPENSGLCSKCYKEHLQRKTAEADGTAPSSADSKNGSVSKEQLSQALGNVVSVAAAANSLPSSTTIKEAIKESIKEATDISKVTTKDTTDPPSEDTSTDSDQSTNASKRVRESSECDSNSNGDTDKPIQKNKKRCFTCNCKLQPAIREIGRCKCDLVFCQLHRLPEQHDCMFDHKGTGRKEARDKMVSPKKHMGTSLKRIDSDS